MKTLLNTYTVIETHEHVKELSEHLDWLAHVYIGDTIAYGDNLGDHDFDAFDPGDLPHRTRVTVEQYIDLMIDRITPWRLGELGFEIVNDGLYDPFFQWKNQVGDTIDYMADSVWCNKRPLEITNFSELQTLIKFLTPKP